MHLALTLKEVNYPPELASLLRQLTLFCHPESSGESGGDEEAQRVEETRKQREWRRRGNEESGGDEQTKRVEGTRKRRERRGRGSGESEGDKEAV